MAGACNAMLDDECSDLLFVGEHSTDTLASLRNFSSRARRVTSSSRRRCALHQTCVLLRAVIAALSSGANLMRSADER